MPRVSLIGLLASCIGCLAMTHAAAADYAGSYVVDDGEFYIELILQTGADGTVSGGMNDDGDTYRLVAQPVEDRLMGAIIADDSEDQYPLFAQLDESGVNLYLRIYTDVDAQGNVIEESGQTFLFYRVGATTSQAARNPYAPGQTQTPYTPQQSQENPYAPAQAQNNPYAPQPQPRDNPYAPQQQQNNPYAPTAQAPGPAAATGSGAEAQLQQFIVGRHILIAYRDGGVVYGTYRYYDVHHCPSGSYLEYGYTSKNSVTGASLTTNWESAGRWQVTTQQGRTGVFYQPSDANAEFVPMQINADGSVFINEGVNFSNEGVAQCQ